VFLSHSFTYQENPIVKTPGYQFPPALHDFSEPSNFKLEHFLLLGGGGIPPCPPKSPPLTQGVNPKKIMKRKTQQKVNQKEKKNYN
jgi:hypothetical protein